MYILNEKDFIRELLVSKQKPKEVSLGYLISLIAKYYYYNCDSPEELSDLVKSKLLEFEITGYQEYKYHTKILNTCKELFQSGDPCFRELEYIPIYQHELDLISILDSERKKKLMFTFFAVARYMDSDGWINKKSSKDISEVFKLANVNITLDQRNALLHDLYIEGLISFAKRIDNSNIRVNLKNDGEVGYKIREFRNLGNQYLGNFKAGFKQCENCGRAIRITGHRKKYCSRCAKEVHKKQQAVWYQDVKKRG